MIFHIVISHFGYLIQSLDFLYNANGNWPFDSLFQTFKSHIGFLGIWQNLKVIIFLRNYVSCISIAYIISNIFHNPWES